MTTYTTITTDQYDADSYIDVNLMSALVNNVLAMFEGDASATGVRLQFDALAASLAPWEIIESQTASASSSIDFEALVTGTYNRFMLVGYPRSIPINLKRGVGCRTDMVLDFAVIVMVMPLIIDAVTLEIDILVQSDKVNLFYITIGAGYVGL